MLDALAALTLFAFVASITPGPNNLMLRSSGTRFGFRRSIPHMLGVMLGFPLMIMVIGLGLARLFTEFPIVQTVLKVASIAYLLYLAFKIATAPTPTVDDGESSARPLTFIQAAAFQWVNPKGWTMALTVLSAYMPPTDPWRGLAIIAALVVLINVPVVTLWTAMGMQLRRFLGQPKKLRAFNLIAAGLLVASLYPVMRGH
jgi:threonine/homoserine/homoserine lactone efflux protein